MSSRVEGDFYFSGVIVIAGGLVTPAGCISNASVIPAAGISATKVQQQYIKGLPLSVHSTAVAAIREQIHRVYGATATILSFGVVASVAAGAASSATIDLKKNGATILTGTITLDNGTAAFALKAGTLASSALVAGDVLEVEVTAVAGANVPKGVTAYLWFNEDPA